MAVNAKTIVPLAHHQQNEVCQSRARYRQGRRETAVKVYTIHQESKYLLIQGVPAIGLEEELRKCCSEFGEVLTLSPLHEYPCEPFTKVYLISYARMQSAKIAKRRLDERSWYGGSLHVCYAPEFESLQETREKLQQRQRFVNNVQRSGGGWRGKSRANFGHVKTPLDEACEEKDEHPAPPTTTTTTYIWAGKEYTITVPPSAENVPQAPPTSSSSSFVIYTNS